ncbi:non-ribosomal peptide synthetase [Moorena bouillonii]|uniref:Carrier domain-containing protein n=1 Tax=Moorena bouillonii PNG TaxID=568701 RepID=A0A1U7N590_9CYAN|nr:non-ribosomal peptide synthetase [Moorena bouillonii]OLT61096.1 hypothetical protein BJP37_20835 [Moorena bouillonii PNG]
MMLQELLTELTDRRIHLSVEGEQLRIRAPKGSLSPQLREVLKERKDELVGWLNQVNAPTTAPVPEIVPQFQERYQPFPLTEMQQAYWVGNHGVVELSSPAHFYSEIEWDNLDLPRLSAAWQRLIERHEMLRAIILPTGEQQILAQVPDYEIEMVDLRGLEEPEVSRRLQAMRDRLSYPSRPRDQWPRFGILVSRFSEEKCLLHFSFDILIIDGFSYQILMKEWVQLYENVDQQLPVLELSFRDYVLTRQTLENTPSFQQSWQYWQNRLSTLPPGPELPLAQQPNLLKTSQFAHLSESLPRTLSEQLKSRAIAEGITPSLALCAAYTEILATWSKNSHFTLALLHLNRLPLHTQVNEIVGNFSTTLLLEVNPTPGGSFADKAIKLQQQLWSDLEHSQVSGVEVVRELNRLQGGAPRPTIPVTFVSVVSNRATVDPEQETPQEVGSPNLWEEQIYTKVRVPQVFIDHQAWERKGELVLNWDYVPELFPEGMIEDMFKSYIRLLRRLAEGDQALQEAPKHLLPAEHYQLQAAINDTEVPVEPELLHTLFINQAVHEPQQVAVIAPTQTLTYQDLYQRAGWLGYQLRQRGAHPNQLVGVVMEKGWEQVVGVLAILMAGAAYVPIDPELPLERRQYLMAQSDLQLVLTQSWLDDSLDWPEDVGRICVDTNPIPPTAPPPLEPLQQGEDLAYVIYTSGSTGVPKGVMIDHRGAVNTVVDINRRFEITADEKVLALSSLNFDLSVYDIFGILAAGGTIVVPEASQLKEPTHWLELLNKHQITVWNSVPALMQLGTEMSVSTGILLSPSLRLVMLSGDWLPLTLPTQLQSLVEGVQVVSLGGATEASIWSIFYPIATVNPDWKSIPYGQPLSNQKFYVLNDELEPCPIEVPGQLYIGGIGLAKGYWKNEQKTEASFIIHPTSGERLYRTGDLGRYLPDGNIEFLGREDFQVKVQGYRIECGEVEAVLQQHPGVKSCLVTVIGDVQGAKQLVGYFVPYDQSELTTTNLRDFLGQKLPSYMVPSALMSLPALPLTANGKVDRRSLPSPDFSRVTEIKNAILPRNEVEHQVAQIWSDLLQVHPISIRDNFFELGGSSFVAMQLMTRIHQQFGQHLPLATLLQEPTVEHLASLLSQPTVTQSVSPVVPIQPFGSQSPFFCVHPIGGHVLCYEALARYLGEEQRFYGLQALGFNGEQEPLNRIEVMATKYIAALREVQPQGPYQLGGWSLGGLIAWEMAQQLTDSGEEVALLALIDSYPPMAKPSDEPEDRATLLASIAQDLGGLYSKSLAVSVEQLRNLEEHQQLAVIVEAAKAAAIFPPEADFQQMYYWLQVFQANRQALHRYVPQPYIGKIVLFCAEESEKTTKGMMAWQQLALGGVEAYSIPGDHYTIIQDPQVQGLAKQLGLHLSFSKVESDFFQGRSIVQVR